MFSEQNTWLQSYILIISGYLGHAKGIVLHLYVKFTSNAYAIVQFYFSMI